MSLSSVTVVTNANRLRLFTTSHKTRQEGELMETALVNLTGLVLIGAIVWWFWLSDSDAPDTDNNHH